MKRDSNIDLLKTISIILVILVHSLPRDVQMLIGRPLILQHAVPIFMVLFGYNRVKSVEKKNITQTIELYKWDYVWKQIKTILVPYILVWLMFEFPMGRYLEATPIEFIRSFALGGRGPGGYFIVLMIQAILFFPILYHIFKKINPVAALTGIFVVNKLLEVMSVNMNPDLYRVLIIRHIFSIALGIYLAKNKDEISIKKWIPLVLVSLVYIISVDYGGVHFTIEHMWDSQHPFAYFWTFLLVYGGLKLPFREFSLVTLIGKSSYFIFLTQKIYFMFRDQFFENISYGVDTVISIIVSVALGIGFYYLAKNNYFIPYRKDLALQSMKRKEK